MFFLNTIYIMSYSNLLSNGKIAAQYLPTEAVVTPTLAQVLAAGADGNNVPVVDIASLAIGTNTLPSGSKLSVAGGAVIDKQLTVVPEDAEVTSILQLRNESVANPAYFDVYAAGATGGGLVDGNLMVYGYSNLTPGPTVIRKLINFTNNGSEVNLGDPAVVGGTIVNVEGTLGAGRVFDSVYNKPVAITPILKSDWVGAPLVTASTSTTATAFFSDSSQAVVENEYWLLTGEYDITSTGSSSSLATIVAVLNSTAAALNLAQEVESTTARRGTFSVLIRIPVAGGETPNTSVQLGISVAPAPAGTVTSTIGMLTYTKLI
jgi:hypothetical protein